MSDSEYKYSFEIKYRYLPYMVANTDLIREIREAIPGLGYPVGAIVVPTVYEDIISLTGLTIDKAEDLSQVPCIQERYHIPSWASLESIQSVGWTEAEREMRSMDPRKDLYLILQATKCDGNCIYKGIIFKNCMNNRYN